MSLNAEESRLTNSRRMLIAGLDRLEERLETRGFAFTNVEIGQLKFQMEMLQRRLGAVNDRLLDIQIAKERIQAYSFKVTFPDMEQNGKRRIRLCNL